MTKIRVVVETPRGASAKYAYDPARRCFVLKHIFPAGMAMPHDFGYVPGTIAEDGDPLDVVVFSEVSTFPGCELECRVVGAITAEQREAGEPKAVRNDRIVVIPCESRAFSAVRDLDALDSRALDDLEAFFFQYHRLLGNEFRALERLRAKDAAKLLDEHRRS